VINYANFLAWLKRSIVATVVGFCLASIVTFLAIEKGRDGTYYMLVAGLYGGCLFGALPGAITAWFLLLHMIGQLRDTIKGK
jgi:uncharacterized membrane protein YidH (DUF202 family)